MRWSCVLPLAAALGLASTATLAQVTVSEPWVRGTVESQMATGAFMRLTAATDARLLGARSPPARRSTHRSAPNWRMVLPAALPMPAHSK